MPDAIFSFQFRLIAINIFGFTIFNRSAYYPKRYAPISVHRLRTGNHRLCDCVKLWCSGNTQLVDVISQDHDFKLMTFRAEHIEFFLHCCCCCCPVLTVLTFIRCELFVFFYSSFCLISKPPFDRSRLKSTGPTVDGKTFAVS